MEKESFGSGSGNQVETEMLRTLAAIILALQPIACFADAAHAPTSVVAPITYSGYSPFAPYLTDVRKIETFGDPVSALTTPGENDPTYLVISKMGITEPSIQNLVERSFEKYFGALPRTDTSKLRGSVDRVGGYGCEVSIIARTLRGAFAVKCELGSHSLDIKRKPIHHERLGFAEAAELQSAIASAIDEATKSLYDFFIQTRKQ